MYQDELDAPPDPKETGLALSGGGFRATLFHLGVFWRFNELGWLKKLTRISSVSGGSIANGVLGVHWHELTWKNDIAENFTPLIADPIQSFCRRNIDIWDVVSGAISPFSRASDKLAESYDDYLFKGKTLQDLPDEDAAPGSATFGPRFTFNATNLQTGKYLRFARPYLADYMVGRIMKPTTPVAIAVAASSAFPPVLSPLVYKPRQDWEDFPKGKAPLFGKRDFMKKLYLSDGGVYDNLGHESLKKCKTLFVSDAGAPPKTLDDIHRGNVLELKRVLDIAMDQARAVRIRRMIDAYNAAQPLKREGKLWTITTYPKNYEVAGSLPCNDAKIAELSSIRTRLNRFDEQEQSELINFGYALADAALRKCTGQGNPPTGWPFPKYPLG